MMTDPANSRNSTPDSWLRTAVQLGFAAYSLLVGWQFHVFVTWLSDPGVPVPQRPAGVEAWLPISSLMSLTHLVRTGEASSVHPAGLVIFSLILVLSFAIGRGFCSWVCPIGTLSEWACKLGRTVLGRNLTPPRWLDIPLRGLRYLVLGFFLYAILLMPAEATRAFLNSPYNRIADVKMYLMFAQMTRLTAIVLGALLVLSVLIRHFWCRYLCPYGALLGLFAWLSPVVVRRDTSLCTDCRKCDQACPNRVGVSRGRRVRSLECTTCFACVKACPAKGALAVAPPASGRAISMSAYAVILVGAFVLVCQAARSAGYWQSSTSPWLYAALHQSVHAINHPRTPRGLSDHRMPPQLPPPPAAAATIESPAASTGPEEDQDRHAGRETQ